jgi:hypothetical protein
MPHGIEGSLAPCRGPCHHFGRVSGARKRPALCPHMGTGLQEDMTVHSLAGHVQVYYSSTKRQALRFIGPISHRINQFDW